MIQREFSFDGTVTETGDGHTDANRQADDLPPAMERVQRGADARKGEVPRVAPRTLLWRWGAGISEDSDGQRSALQDSLPQILLPGPRILRAWNRGYVLAG